ncbi:MAG: hypothetical protein RDU83_04860 [bacterium]|nr:hypothetical protein [bacterium]
MSVHRLLAGALLAVWLLASVAIATAEPQARPEPPVGIGRPKADAVRRQGDAYCFDRPMSLGNVVIAGGRCYTFYLLRNSGGSFLGFGPPGPPMIPPGQIVRLGTPAGAKLNGRLFHMVPLPRPATGIPFGSISLANVRIVWESGRFVIYIPGITTEGDQRDLEMPFMQR